LFGYKIGTTLASRKNGKIIAKARRDRPGPHYMIDEA
jgi:hypothetical protein